MWEGSDSCGLSGILLHVLGLRTFFLVTPSEKSYKSLIQRESPFRRRRLCIHLKPKTKGGAQPQSHILLPCQVGLCHWREDDSCIGPTTIKGAQRRASTAAQLRSLAWPASQVRVVLYLPSGAHASTPECEVLSLHPLPKEQKHGSAEKLSYKCSIQVSNRQISPVPPPRYPPDRPLRRIWGRVLGKEGVQHVVGSGVRQDTVQLPVGV